MVFFVDSGGNVLNTTPENVYQGSANANEIVLVGQFPANSVVEVAYKLPNGIWTEPQVMSAFQTASNGFTVWKTRLNGVVTERFGKVSLQFYIYGGTEEEYDGALLATAETSFNVGKGVPRMLPDNFPTEVGYDEFVSAVQGAMTTAAENLQMILEDKVQKVNSAFNSKVDKFEGLSIQYAVYTQLTDGSVQPVPATSLESTQTLILRDANGRAQVSPPARDGDIANKWYVDRIASTKLTNEGDAVFIGDFTIDGNLTVTGETTTVESEKLEVADNFIFVNANGVENIVSGLIIKTKDRSVGLNAYAILYNPVTNSVELGSGSYDRDGNFEFYDPEEMQSIATRQASESLPDGALLRWDAEKNTLVDTGLKYDQIALKENVPTVKLEAVGDGSYALIVNTVTEE